MREFAVNDAGLRIGEDHPNAKLTDAEVERIRSLHEDDGMTYEALAEKFEASRWAIGRICRYERRGQIVARWKKTPTDEDFQRIAELRAQGLSWREVGIAIGIPDLKESHYITQLREQPHEQRI